MRATTLGFTIDSIRAQSWQSWELLVVGQGASADDVRQVVEAAAVSDDRIKFLQLPTPGLSRARNAAAAAATGTALAFTDDDCEADVRWLETIAAAFEDPSIGAVGGSVVAPPASRRLFSTCPAVTPSEAVYDPRSLPGSPPVGWDWIGANFAVRREVFDRVGSFDPHLGAGARFPAGEDSDYKLRLESEGVVVLTTPRSVVHHTHGRRDGLRAVIRLSRSYATGNGATAAKLTLRNDPRGVEWYGLAKRMEWRRPLKVPAALYRFLHFRRAYVACVGELHEPLAGPNPELRAVEPAAAG